MRLWITRTEIIELFKTAPQNITMHIPDVYSSEDVFLESTSNDCLLVDILKLKFPSQQLFGISE
jgi:hypothetical protein